MHENFKLIYLKVLILKWKKWEIFIWDIIQKIRFLQKENFEKENLIFQNKLWIKDKIKSLDHTYYLKTNNDFQKYVNLILENWKDTSKPIEEDSTIDTCFLILKNLEENNKKE